MRPQAAAKNRCKRRKVFLMKVVARHSSTVGKVRSKPNGSFSFHRPHAHGTYFAKAIKKVFFLNDGTRVICRGDKSKKENV